MSGGEIITLQFGGFSNHVGCHFFNTQSAGFSFNPDLPTDVHNDLLFREGKTASFSYTPRLVLVDLDQNLGGLSKSGWFQRETVTEEEVRKTMKLTQLETKVEEKVEPSEYHEDVANVDADDGMNIVLKSKYDLNVKSWTDCLTLALHENTIVTVPKPICPDETSTFDSGAELWSNSHFRDELEDAIRFQLEDCDNPQGFHVLIDPEYFFSGLGTACLESVKEDCGKKVFATVPLWNGPVVEEDVSESWKKSSLQALNTAFMVTGVAESSDFIVPLSTQTHLWGNGFCQFPHLNYKSELDYHRSAILGIALDMVTLPYRLKPYQCRMADLASAIVTPCRKLLTTALRFPCPDSEIDPNFINYLEKSPFTSVTPFSDGVSPDRQIITSRGYPRGSLPVSPFIYTCSQNLRLPRTWPDLIDSQFNLTSSLHYGRLREVRAMGSLQNNTSAGLFLDKVISLLKNLNLNKLNASMTSTTEQLNYKTCMEQLEVMATDYTPVSYL